MLRQKLTLQKNIKFILFAVILSSIAILTLYEVDGTLACDPSLETVERPKTYLEAYDKGANYSSKGQAREFLYLYLWKPNKAKQGYTNGGNFLNWTVPNGENYVLLISETEVCLGMWVPITSHFKISAYSNY